MHGLHHIGHHLAAFLRGFGGAQRQLAGLTSIFGVLFHRRGQLLHAGGGFFQRGSLLFGT
ncbi:hypothetical protein D3C78_1519130 [compost metagenome]